jgi:hypothetical protein
MTPRFFNTAGPVRRDLHYCLPPLERLNLAELMTLIEQQKYFVLHAPRQTGKTSTLLALMEQLNRQGHYRCLYVNVETGQAARENVGEAMRALLSALGSWARDGLHDLYLKQIWPDILRQEGPYAALGETLSHWAAQSPQPTILLLDEIDALVGDTLISVLRQLRAGYAKRPAHFPQSIILCGVRDVRDYRIHSSQEKAIITGGSAFNIKAESLRLGNFNQAELESLYRQHTAETGQAFEPAALELAGVLTGGQPWLVNALAYEACFKLEAGRDRSRPITPELLAEAKERLILRRDTHLDQLTDKLQEERVRRVISPMLQGDEMEQAAHEDDIQYVLDLGLVARRAGGLQIANAIYREIIPRQLNYVTQLNFESTIPPAWYVQPDGRLDVDGLLAAFQQFFRENSEIWLERFDYREAGPQLLIQAFLQRIVNSQGRVEREYGLGRRRTDLLVIWPHPGGVQRAVIELKILHGTLERTISDGLAQTWEYLDRCGGDVAHLVIFDTQCSPGKSWDEKIFVRAEAYQGRPIKVWGM